MNNPEKANEESLESKTQEKLETKEEDNRPVCGLIMPIADTGGYPIGH